jgi:hypothetical protein
MRVRDVMTQDVATVAPDAQLVGNTEQAQLIEAFVDRVPGVVGITSRLHWEDGR